VSVLRHDPTTLPADLPVPTNDGAAAHLLHAHIPPVVLEASQGDRVNLREFTQTPAVLFFYPRTGVPGEPPGAGFSGESWDSIPGARGCTPQSCSFRDTARDFASLGVRIAGIATNTAEHQREFASRMHITYPLLSDSALALTRAMRLPTFEFPDLPAAPGRGPMPTTMIRRMAWYVERGVIRRVWYPVFPPDQNAATVLAWLRSRSRVEIRPTTDADRAFVRDELVRHWRSPMVWSLGRGFDAPSLPGFIARVDGQRAGFVAIDMNPGGYQCEVVALISSVENAGVGEHLLEAAADAARDAGCTRIFLTTSNDNLRAIGFYQKRGWRLSNIALGSIDRARAFYPEIPRVGLHDIPMRDEIEFELYLRPATTTEAL
jgi:peroxiredoxin/GNAT superfamily N-acetyltransferase